MSKRDNYMANLESSRQQTLESIKKRTNSVDDVIEEINQKIDIQPTNNNDENKNMANKENETKKKDKPGIVLNGGLALDIKPRGSKLTVRKCFVFSPELNEVFTQAARDMKVSENELVNEILKKAFDL